ncbi:Alternative oxidase 3 [Spatholobus suberectus]|nr:Alternative oxidase 3 [Spatholobus suberectus]
MLGTASVLIILDLFAPLKRSTQKDITLVLGTFLTAEAYRFVGYLEEEDVVSYIQHLNAIESGKVEKVFAFAIAIDYWRLPKDATLEDVITVIHVDKAYHRDVNHFAFDVVGRYRVDEALCSLSFRSRNINHSRASATSRRDANLRRHLHKPSRHHRDANQRRCFRARRPCPSPLMRCETIPPNHRDAVEVTTPLSPLRASFSAAIPPRLSRFTVNCPAVAV